MVFNPRMTDIVIDVGGETWRRYGTLVRRTWPADVHGEDAKHTHTRASPGGLITSAGGFLPAGNNQPRLTWIKDANGIYQPRYLSEAAAAQKLTFPEDLSNAAWAKIASTVPSTNNPSPRNGDLTASFVREDTTAAAHGITQGFARALNGNTMGVTGFFKANGRTKGLWRLCAASEANTFDVNFDLGAGTAALTAAGTGSGSFVQIVPLANGWFAMTAYGVPSTGDNGSNWRLYFKDNSGNLSYTGDGASGMYVWGCVATDNQIAGMYWGTGASRVADKCLIPFPYKPQAMWWYVKFVELGSARINFANLVSIASAYSGERLFLRQAGTGGPYHFDHVIVSTEAVATAAAAPSQGDLVEQVCLVGGNGSTTLLQSLNGGPDSVAGPSGANAFTSQWETSFMSIGSDGTGGFPGLSAFGRVVVGLNSLPSSTADVRTVLASMS